MASKISTPFIRFPVATSLLMAGLLLVGVVAYPQLPVAPLPEVDFPTIQVSANLPGADPATMAATVAQPLESQFSLIPGVAEMTSSSQANSTQITLQFDLSRNIDGAGADVLAAINAAAGQLPKNLPSPPTYRKVNPADSPILLLSATSDNLPLTQVSDEALTKLAQAISQIGGVGQVNVGGQQTPSIRVQVEPAKLAARGLSLEDIRTPLSVTTVNSPKGTINGSARAYTIYANDQLTDARSWNDVIIAYRDGNPVRVRDIGQAVSAPLDDTQAGWADGKPGVFLVIFKQPGANVIATVDKVMEALPHLTAGISPGIKIGVLSDRTQTIRAAVKDVQFTLLVTIALVVLVIFVFLRSLWATIIPSLTVPLALLGACALMWFAGYSLDNLSLMALTIAVGFVVDDAIVMLENITRHIEDGEEPMAAAIKGTSEIGFTILSISISLVAVLIPLLLMGGIIGRLFREFSVTLAMAILASAVISLTLTPMMASRFMKPLREVHHGRIYQASDKLFRALAGAYERSLDVALRFRFATLMVFFATLALTVYLFVIIPKGFFPQQDTGLITGVIETAQDTSIGAMARHMEDVGAIVLKDPAVDHMAMRMGGTGGTLNDGLMYITLKPREERTASADEVIRRLRAQTGRLEGASLYLQAAQDVRVGGRPSRTQFQFTLQGTDVAQLDEWAPKLLARMKAMPELRDVASDQQAAGSTLTLTFDRDQAARYGLTPDVIDATLYDAFGQRQIASDATQLSTYYVVLEVLPSLQQKIATLDQIYLRSATTGGNVPLAAIATWSTVPAQPLAINHQGQFPAVTISFNLAPGIALGQATAAIGGLQNAMDLPATITTSFQGTAQAFQDSLASVPMLIAAALVVVYLILGILYESYIHPLTILSTLPSAGVGALATLLLFGFDFSLIALIGLILLIGIVKKNGIMMVDFAIAAEREQGLSSLEAIRRACLLRFRPILMTTMAALLGGVPLMLGHGTGSEIRQPLGYAMVGGLFVSQLLTLFTTPVIYLYLDAFSNWLVPTRSAKAAGIEEGHRAVANTDA
ncbi:efflux RND transporter permease subunit [Bosea sp. RAF48]|uniref:efflux RND transporter permease subunit n=1 Tax=Bosea sp. RAF48 TaxID=3237480 RepID=UPI003F8FE017